MRFSSVHIFISLRPFQLSKCFFLCTPSPPSATTGIQSSFLFFFQGFVYYYGGIEWSRQRGGHALVHPCIAAGLCKGHGSFDADADASKAVMRVHARTHPAFLRSSLPQAADPVLLHYNSAIRVARAKLLLLQRPETSRHSSLPFALYCCIIARVSFMNKNAR